MAGYSDQEFRQKFHIIFEAKAGSTVLKTGCFSDEPNTLSRLDIPDRFAITSRKSHPSGIAIWGQREDGSWYGNPSAHCLIRQMMDSIKELNHAIHNMVTAEQAAWIEWKHGKGADAGMQWIENGLFGPGLIPGDTGPYSKRSQHWYDANRTDAYPRCICGLPSSICGHDKDHRVIGACCQEHYEIQRDKPKEIRDFIGWAMRKTAAYRGKV